MDQPSKLSRSDPVTTRMGFIVVTDAKGFSRASSIDSAGTARRIQQDLALFGEAAARNSGEVRKSTGDGLIVTFDRIEDAIEFWKSAELARLEDDLVFSHYFSLHIGQITLTESDVYGDAVNHACRILQIEKTAHVLSISAAAYAHIGDHHRPLFRYKGARRARNLPAPIQLWQTGGTEATFSPRRLAVLGGLFALILLLQGERLTNRRHAEELARRSAGYLAATQKGDAGVDRSRYMVYGLRTLRSKELLSSYQRIGWAPGTTPTADPAALLRDATATAKIDQPAYEQFREFYARHFPGRLPDLPRDFLTGSHPPESIRVNGLILTNINTQNVWGVTVQSAVLAFRDRQPPTLIPLAEIREAVVRLGPR